MNKSKEIYYLIKYLVKISMRIFLRKHRILLNIRMPKKIKKNHYLWENSKKLKFKFKKSLRNNRKFNKSLHASNKSPKTFKYTATYINLKTVISNLDFFPMSLDLDHNTSPV